jgi:hypothetical protein
MINILFFGKFAVCNYSVVILDTGNWWIGGYSFKLLTLLVINGFSFVKLLYFLFCGLTALNIFSLAYQKLSIEFYFLESCRHYLDLSMVELTSFYIVVYFHESKVVHIGWARVQLWIPVYLWHQIAHWLLVCVTFENECWIFTCGYLDVQKVLYFKFFIFFKEGWLEFVWQLSIGPW